MEVKYINKVEDIEFLIRYMQYKLGFTKYKYIVCSITFVSGIYYSIKLQDLFYFFTSTIVITSVLFFWLKKTEDKDISRISKNRALKKCRKDKYFTSEKILTLKDGKILIHCNGDEIEIKLERDVEVKVIDKYILIISMKSPGYKKKIIIPSNTFETEEKMQKFIESIKSIIDKSKITI